MFFYLVIVCLIAAGTAVMADSRPVFSVAVDTNMSVAVGKTAVLNCTVFRARGYKIAWIDKARGVVLSMEESVVTGNPRVGVQLASGGGSGASSWLLTLQEVRESDAGVYMCQVNTKPRLRKDFMLSVVTPPSISDSASSADVEAPEGGTAVLRCSASGRPRPSITWRREDGALIRLGATTEKLVQGSSLTLSALHRADSGAYLCIANNGVPPSVSKRVQLTVAFGPVVEAVPRLVGAFLGESANLSCLVWGWPRPSAHWIRERGEKIQLDTEATGYDRWSQALKYKFGSVSVNSTAQQLWLSVSRIEAKDLRAYRCVANSSMGTADDRTLLYEMVTSTSLSQPSTPTAYTQGPATHHQGDSLPWRPVNRNQSAPEVSIGVVGEGRHQPRREQPRPQQHLENIQLFTSSQGRPDFGKGLLLFAPLLLSFSVLLPHLLSSPLPSITKCPVNDPIVRQRPEPASGECPIEEHSTGSTPTPAPASQGVLARVSPEDKEGDGQLVS